MKSVQASARVREQEAALVEVRKLDTLTMRLNEADVRCLVVELADERSLLIPLWNVAPADTDPEVSRQEFQMPDGVTFAADGQMDVVVFSGAIRTSVPVGNRRDCYRIQKPGIRVELSVDERTWSDVTAEDLSEGGTLLADSDSTDISVGQKVFLRLYISGDNPILASGVVCRTNNRHCEAERWRSELGIQFTMMSSESKRVLVQYIYRYQIEHAHVR